MSQPLNSLAQIRDSGAERERADRGDFHIWGRPWLFESAKPEPAAPVVASKAAKADKATGEISEPLRQN
jgi:hypothetical protein